MTPPDKREAAFQRYLTLTEPYFAKVAEAGDEPWFSSEAERRELFMRRHTRPAPPAGLHRDPRSTTP